MYDPALGRFENAMNLQARKLELVQMILNTDQPNLLVFEHLITTTYE
jgi:hypothetical protein